MERETVIGYPASCDIRLHAVPLNGRCRGRVRVCRRRGYTLIEMLVALALFVMAAVAVGATAAGGLRVFARARTFNVAEEDLMLSLERLERDIRNTFRMGGLDFAGTATRLSMPGMVRSEQQGETPFQAPGRISYYVDQGRQALIVQRDPYGKALSGEFEASRQYATELTDGIEAVHFEYLRFDAETRQFEWSGAWAADEPALPVAVRVTLKPVHPLPHEMTRIVFIPIAQTRWSAVRQ